ncbi:MAG: citrate/2-methylcitrate synthase, partial [Acidobacteriaceae bacterium]
MSTTPTATPPAAGKGLEGIVAANSGICWIDGDHGVLAYRGIDIHELAQKSTFEETAYLLINGKLPTRQELAQYKKDLGEARYLHPDVTEYMKRTPKDTKPMEVLRTAVSMISSYDPDEDNNSHEANLRKSTRIISRIAMIVAIWDRVRKGKA